jgi:RNA polymerase sigma-70 factor (ECF subfamily)
MDHTLEFQHLRPALFGLAYRMLGTRADAEDVVQEAWLRWEGAGTDEVRNPRAFLRTTVARLSLDALKSAHRKRESYLGSWLPEPLLDATGTQPIELAESLSLAFLHILESLSHVNGQAGLLLLSGSRPVSIVTIDVDEHDRIRSIFVVNNPDKLPGSLSAQRV